MKKQHKTGGLTVSEIMERYCRDRDAREMILDERIMDLNFARLSQNEDIMSKVSTNEYQGQFDIISREKRRIQAEQRKKEIEVLFRDASAAAGGEVDEILQGMYRTECRTSRTRQCFNIAQDDQIDCGFGAWRLVTEEENNYDALDTNLVVRREPIPEALRSVFFDANARMADQSDAKCCSVITAFTKDGYERFLEDNNIALEECGFTSFDQPYESIYEVFNGFRTAYMLFNNREKTMSILEFFNIEEKKQVYYLYIDAEGEIVSMTKEEAKASGMGEPLRKKELIERECWRYVTNGIDVLKRDRVPGGMIPIIPVYGERNFVKGTENFYGIVKAAKDPQCLINSALNYVATLVMYSPIPKPEFDPREIEGVEHYHEGSANAANLAYRLRNKYVADDKSGTLLNFHQATYSQPASVPPAVATLLQTLPSLTDSILNPGLTEDAFNTQASGVALDKVVEQLGIQTYLYLDNFAEARRRDAEVWAAMNAEILDTRREVVTTNADGSTSVVVVNDPVYDLSQIDDKERIVGGRRNAITGRRFNVYYEVGPSHLSKHDATVENLRQLYVDLSDGDPMKKVVQLMIVSMSNGEGMSEVKKYARYELLSMGLPGFEPRSDEEKAFIEMLMQAKQGEAQQGDPMSNMLAQQVMTERLKAESKAAADAAKIEIDIQKAQAEIRLDNAKAEEIEIKNRAAMRGVDLTDM